MLIEDLEKRLPDCQSGDQFRSHTAGAAKEKRRRSGEGAESVSKRNSAVSQSLSGRDMAIPRQMCYPAELPVSENASKLDDIAIIRF